MSATVSATASSLHQIDALVEDDLALVVHDVVEFEQVLADVEVARLDLLLRLLQRLVDPRMDDRLVLLQAEALKHGVEPVRPEDAHQVVFERQEEFRATGIALAARAAAQLVVDAPRLVALGADDVEAAGLDDGLALVASTRRLFGLEHDVAEFLDIFLDRAMRRSFSASSAISFVSCAMRISSDAAELDVGAAAGHVGRDRDRARHAGLRRRYRLPARGNARSARRTASPACCCARQHRVSPAPSDRRSRSACSRSSSGIRRAVPTSRSRRCRPAPAGSR